jgi:pyruvate formate lyase activating enzyme
LAQPRFTRALLAACRERGINTAIETCGYAYAEVFASIAPLANLLLFDLKVVDANKHKLLTGVDNGPILANLARAAGWGVPLTVRIPVVPGLNDGPADAQQVASCLAALRLRHVELLPYHNTGSEKYHRLGWNYRLPDTPHASADEVARFAAPLAAAGLHVETGV